jgi:hypothetical protein
VINAGIDGPLWIRHSVSSRQVQLTTATWHKAQLRVSPDAAFSHGGNKTPLKSLWLPPSNHHVGTIVGRFAPVDAVHHQID